MPPAKKGDKDSGPKGLNILLAKSLIGVVRVPIKKIILTSMGRAQRETGILQIMESIKSDGWVEISPPICSLVADPEDKITEDNAGEYEYRCIDGNHRVAALQRMDAENCQDTSILVHLHRSLTAQAERFIAGGEGG